MLALGFLANCLKLVLNYELILLGRFVLGITSGMLNVAFGKCLNETIPNEHMQTYTLWINSGFCLGIFLINLLQVLLVPIEEDGEEAMMEDQMWRLIFGCTMASQLVFGLVIHFKFPILSLR
mmetsp:Transcript_5134/g.8730  ORF Transcript_5134/g.8730 Transcript_5134/m.8730 type:complete len:122 (-) Transcript_5134:1278-1643(-)